MVLCLRAIPSRQVLLLSRSLASQFVRRTQGLSHPASLQQIHAQRICVRLLTTNPADRNSEAERIMKEYGVQGKGRKREGIMMSVSLLFLMLGISAACVPLYKIFCSATGYGGTTKKHGKEAEEKLKKMGPVEWRPITVSFTSMVNPCLDWSFEPVVDTVELVPGETCLAFFTAKNNSNEVLTGISTYNVIPYEAGSYFNKIQCFCFDEQTLHPGEELDMPVFFYIDPEFALDPDLIRDKCDNVVLHYTFYNTDEKESRFDIPELVGRVTSMITGEDKKQDAIGFKIPEGENIHKVNDLVYKEVVRKGYEKDFVVPGCKVVCHVTGSVKDTGRVFWCTKDGTPFTYTAGIGSLIEGWEEGCIGMSEGEISKIVMSSKKGYGKIGNRSWNIPGHTDLEFEIEILAVR